MEYVDGPDLAAFSQAVQGRGERIPAGLAAWIVREVARGLHYAHERRDDDGSRWRSFTATSRRGTFFSRSTAS